MNKLTNTLNHFTINGITYSQTTTGYRYKTTGRKNSKGQDETIRIGKAEFEKAREEHTLEVANKQKAAMDKLVELNRQQNEANEFTNISQEDLDRAVEEAKESATTEEIHEIQEEMKSKKVRKPRAKKPAFFTSVDVPDITLTDKQVSFILHLPDAGFWDNGLDSSVWVDCLCDAIGGQFAGKPMTVGAMVSTLREKGLLVTLEGRPNGRKAKYIALTEQGKKVAAELGLK